jgi:protein-S-isoprenylcysteine O-methyltransferase Ste14
MFGGLTQALIMACSALAFGALDRVMTQRYDAHRTAGGTATTWRYMASSGLLACGLIAQPLVWPGLTLALPAPWGYTLQLVGIACMALSLALNAWSRIQLGALYAQRAEVQPAHRVICEGPYAYVRHPIFAAYFMVSTGLLLVIPSAPMLIVALYTYVLFTQTALRDERLLRSELPGYAEYMAVTPRFFPNMASLIASARLAAPSSKS